MSTHTMYSYKTNKMANVNISIKEEAYNYLKMLKGKDKSFSDVILEMKEKGTTKSLFEFAGKIKHLDKWKFDKIREELNEEFNKRMETIKERKSQEQKESY